VLITDQVATAPCTDPTQEELIDVKNHRKFMFTPHTLIELLARRAMQQAQRCAYTFLPEGESEQVCITYGELEERVRSAGAALARMGASGERVMLLFPPGLDYITAFFGCLYAGAVAVPAYPPRPNRSLDRIESIADDSQAVIALTTSQLLSKAKTFVSESPVLSKLQWLSLEELEAEKPPNWEPTHSDPNALAYLQYTSGSTAQPKGVMISHANVLHNAAYIHHGFEHTPDSISLSWLPHFHDMGLIDGIIVPLFGSFHGYLMPPAAFLQKPLRWLQAVTRLSITHTGGPNFAYELCMRRIGHEDLNELDLRTWSVAYNGAEPVRSQTLERFASTFASCGFRPEVFYPAYGLAEATLKVTGGSKSSVPARCALSAEALQHHRLLEVAENDPDARVLVGSGYVDAGTRVEIVDPESHTMCGEPNVGEIWVSSPSVAGGYWNRPDETEQTFHAYLADTGDGPFLRTGDLGFVRGGELFITGRLKDVIITRGLNHYPQDIERSMEESHPALRPGCGAAFSIESGGEERLVLVQEVDRSPEASPEDVIMSVLRAVGQDHEVQAHAIVLVKPHSVPKTSSGKIQRHLCRQRYLEGSLEVVAEWREATPEDRSVQAGTPRREPAEIESWLAARIATRLGLRYAELDVDTPIARFGLDSLTAIELTHELETELSLRLPMASLLQDFSIAQLAARLATDAGVDGQLAYEPLAEPADEYPLSYGQRAMWFLYRLAPESPAYNIPVAVRIPGELDSAAFRHAFESLIARHASLRATFHESPDGGGPVQRISEQAAFDFVELDASDWTEEQLRAHLLSEAHKHFDLGTGPVLRVTLLQRSAHERVLLLVVHHIVADFWSLATMMRELAAFYDAARDGQTPSLPALALEYTDYVRLQARAIEGQQGERLAAFWEQQFESEPPKLDLPTDHPRPPVQTFVGRSHTIKLDADLTQSLKNFGRAHGATLYMTLLAAFQVLLHRYTGQTDFAIGSPSSGRNHHKLTDVVGYFVNPLVLRADLAGNPTFEDLLDQVRRRVLAAFEHQDFPFPVLVERLRPTRDASYSPLFQAMFILQKAHSRSVAGMASLALGEAGSRVELGGLTLESLSLDQRVAQFDLTLMMVEEDEGLAASWQYNTDLFEAPTIARMAAHFKTTLAKLINDPSLPVSQLPLLSAAEQQQLLVDWNETTAPFPDESCIHELIEQQARRTPGAVALVFEGEQLTYNELDEKANQLARYLRARGVGAETRVGVLLERSIQLVVALLGVLKAGGAYVPLDSEYPEERLSFMAEDASLALVITGERLAERAREWGVAVVNLDEQGAEVARESRDQLTPLAGPDNLAYVIYTSGSTGKPKGAMLAHRGIVNRLQWMQDTYKLTPQDRVLQKTPYSFDVSVWEFFWPLMYGATLVVARPRGHQDSAYLVKIISDQRITTMHFVPSMLQVFLREKGLENCRSLRQVICSGEALPSETESRFYAALKADLHNLYGPTEASIDVTYWACERESKRRLVPIGRPIANTRVYILDQQMQPVPIGVPGELYLGGVALARGYHARPDLTADRFVPDPFSIAQGARLYRTGDLTRYLAGGEIEFLGRTDHQVKVRGFRVELGEIEAALGNQTGVRDCVVVAREVTTADQRLVAYIAGDKESIKLAELRQKLREQLPEYMVPSSFVLLEELPLTPNGKVDRKQLPAPEQIAIEEHHVSEQPRSPVTEVLAGICEQLLGIQDINIHANFFDLGGHSLLAMQVISRLNDAFDLEVPLYVLFESPTVAALAQHVEVLLAGSQAAPAIPLVPAPREGALPLSDQQRRLWFLSQLEPDNPFYNMAGTLRLRGPLDVDALEWSFGELVQRHEVLRTTFPEVDGDPVQVVASICLKNRESWLDRVSTGSGSDLVGDQHAIVPDDHDTHGFDQVATAPCTDPIQTRFLASTDVTLPLIDLATLPNDEKEKTLESLLREEAQRPFDLKRGPLLRLRLLRLSEDEHVLLLAMHHIISDGWSTGVLLRDLKSFYESRVKGTPADLPSLPVQYADYAAWQERRAADHTEQLEYWVDRLADVPDVLALPTDYSRSAASNHRAGAVSFAIPAEVSAELKALGRREGATLFMTLMAGFQALLFRHSGQARFAVGTPVAGRQRPELQDLIGFFVNTLALPADLSGDPSFVELLQRVRAEALAAYTHQEAPFERVVERLQPTRTLDRAPLFQVMLALDNTPQQSLTLADLDVQRSPLRGTAAKYDLTFSLEESAAGLRGVVEFRSDLFAEHTARCLADRYLQLLQGAMANPAAAISQLPLLTTTERQQMLVEWNQTERPYPATATLPQLFAEQVRRTPHAVALVFEDQSLTYAELDAGATQLAHRLRGLGVGPESRVGILLDRSLELVVALLGVLKAGAAYVPLDAEYPAERLAFMAQDAGLSLVLTSEARAALATWNVPVLTVSPLPDAIETDSLPHIDPDNLAYVIYTSGSTGIPKGVCVSHRAICNHLLWRQETYPLGSSDRFLQKATVSFDIAVWEIFAPLISGAQLILAKPGGQQDSAYLVQLITAAQITTVHFGPAMLWALLDEPDVETCVSLRQVFCGGEPLTPELQTRFFERLNANLAHQYGPTETTVDVTIWNCHENDQSQRIPIGRPIANTRVYILDQQMQPVPIGVPGELYLSGVALARGYHARADLTAERFVPDPFSLAGGERLYRTGDLARYLAGGEIEFLGRTDHQVKVRGFRVELGEIEAVLASQTDVGHCVVEKRDDRLIAYVVGKEGKTLVIRELRQRLKERLPEYMVPSSLVLLEELPLTPSIKVDRNRLPSPDALDEAIGSVKAPETPTEELLAGIYEELLGLGRVSVVDDFFELGGHSLLALRLMSRVRQHFGVELPVRKVFETSTVRDLAAQIDEAMGLGRTSGEHIPRRSTTDKSPLSPAQQRLWFLDQLEPGNPAYNMSAAVRMTGVLNLEALERSLSEIVRRHEVLRVSFQMNGDEPVQVVGDPMPFKIPVSDLSGLTNEAREAEVLHNIKEQAELPFDLARGPLLRAMLLRIAPEEQVLLFTMHHIVSDGWSVDVLVRELVALYEGNVTNQPAQLPQLPIQYTDFAAWQREWLTGEILNQQLLYWKDALGAATALALPTDKPRPPIKSYRGKREAFRLSPHLLHKLKTVSRQHGVTLFMTLLAGLKTLLSRYTNQNDLVVGTPIAGRNHPEVEPLIGFFVNTLALRSDLSGDPSFAELLVRVREVALAAYANQDVPFEMLVEELSPERDLSRPPLFQVMLTLQHVRDAELRLPGLECTLLRTASETSKFDLLMSLEESEEGLFGVLEYSTDLFEAGTVQRMTRHFETLLEAATENPELRLSELPLLNADEREALIAMCNEAGPSSDSRGCLHKVFEQKAATRPDATAVVYGSEQITYGELNRRANRLAHHLRSLGVGPDSRVGLCLERSIEMVIGLLGVLKAGAAYVPLDPQYPAQRLSFMLDDSAVAVVLTQNQIAARLSEYTGTVIFPAEVELQPGLSEANPESGVTLDNLVYVLYTSGSTGVPKGTALKHGALTNLISWQHGRSPVPEGARTLQFASLSFDVSFQEIFSTLCEGGTLVLISEDDRRDPVKLLSLLENERIQRLYLPFVALRQLAEAAGSSVTLPDLQQVITAGEQLQITPAVAQFFSRLDGCTLHNHYGPSESHVVTTYDLAGDPSLWPLLPPIGRPVANTSIYVLDRRLEPAPLGVAGELYIGGVAIARGYHARPSLTAERFIPDPFSSEPGARLYRTGDQARYLANGQVEYLGRVDQQVKVRGFRVELGEVEAALAECDGVRQAVVLAKEHRLAAYVIPDEGRPAPTISALREELRQRLPEYMLPSAFIFLSEWPLTPSGKVDRLRLPAPDPASIESGVSEPASTPTEELLAGTWHELLGVSRVGVNENFFELGGHSLLAARLVARVRELFRVDVALRKVFERPTVKGLAATIDELLREGGTVSQPIERRSKAEGAEAVLSPSQQRLWFLDQLDPQQSTYNIASATRLQGQLNVLALEQSFNEVARRHDVMRTTFPNVAGEPVAVIHAPHDSTSIEMQDLTGLSDDARDAATTKLIDEESQKPFDLAHGPLWRAALVKLDDDHHILLFTTHHIISDGWSLGVLVRELATCYEAFSEGSTPALPELPVQFADYAEWLHERLDDDELERQLGYCEQRLVDVAEALEFPTDRPRLPSRSRRAGIVQFMFPPDVLSAVKSLSLRHEVTLYMTLLAVFEVLLYRHTGQKLFAVGSPMAGRNREELLGLIGFFVNTLALRSDLSGDPTFAELLLRVRAEVLGAHAHSDVPFERLVERLQPSRSVDRSPLFQAVLALDNTPHAEFKLKGLEVERLPLHVGSAKYDLSLSLRDEHDGLSATLSYDADIFDETTARRFIDHYVKLIESAVAEPAERVSKLPLLTEEEQQLIDEWNETQRAYESETTVHALVEQIAQLNPDALAVAFEGNLISYAELNARANKLARYLRRLGAGLESRIGIMMGRSTELVVTLLGVLKAGAVYVPLDPDYPAERLAFMARDAGLELVLTDKPVVSSSSLRVINLEDTWAEIEKEDADAPEALAGPDNLAYIIYTSGSTGVPKGVCISHRSLLNLVHWHHEAFAVTPHDRATQIASLSFDASVWEIWPYLTAGASVHLPNEETRVTPERLRDWLVSEAITISFLPTPLAEQVLSLQWPHEVTLRTLLTGGDKLQKWPSQSLPFAVINNYGPTEFTVVATSGRVHSDPSNSVAPSIGRPIANTAIHILDDHFERVAVGVAGEIYAGGANLARGYHARPELTAERFIPDPFSDKAGARLYRTGDRARYLANGEIEFLGRVDNQIKLRGYRIELGEIENVVSGAPQVNGCAVIAHDDPAGRRTLVAYVASHADASTLDAELRALLKARVPDYMIPSVLVVLDVLPITPNGKIDRDALAALAPQFEATEPYVAPRNATEELLAKLWSDVLAIERVGVNDNFFALGGHSLIATQLIWKIHESFGIDLPVRSLFEHSTVAALSELIESEQMNTSRMTARAIVPVARERFRVPPPSQDEPEVLRKG